MEQNGTLATTPFGDVLIDLMNTNYSGGLVVSHGRVEKVFLFEAGYLVQANSPVPEESLVHMLKEDGTLDEAQFERASQLCEKGASEEKALLSLKVLGPKELVLALRERSRRRCLSCFGWPAGDWRLDPGKQAPKGSEAFRVDLVDLVCRGYATQPLSDALLQRVSALFPRYANPSEAFEDILSRMVMSEANRFAFEGVGPNETVWTQLGPKQGAQIAPAILGALLVLDRSGALTFADKPGEDAATEETPELDAQPAVPESDIEVLVAGSAEAKAHMTSQEVGTVKTETVEKGQSDAAKALAGEIEEKHQKLSELDYYELLGLAKDASSGEIKKSYLKAAKRFHPDALARHGLGELKEKAGEVFGQISKAHTVLSDPAQRRDYDQGGAAEIDTDRLMQAEMFYRQAEIMLRAGRFNDAAPLLENTVKLWPEEAAYQGTLGWVLFKKRPSEPERAREHLEQAISMCDDDAELFFHFSVVLKKLGESSAANAALAKAKSLDPSIG